MSSATTTNSATNSAIVTDYKARTERSGALFERAHKVLPSGITHDARYLDPYSIHVSRAKGPRKWDVDGNEYIDYFGGHGAMLLGHSHPAVIEAVKKQIELGTHYGSSHELEVRWAELVCELTPCAERVRFTGLGHRGLAYGDPAGARPYGQGQDRALRRSLPRLARQCLGRRGRELRRRHTPGVPQSVSDLSIVMPSDDVAAVVKLIEERDDIAAVMFEPSGASWGQVPLPPGFVQAVRDATAKKGVVMLMDEVITGYRWSSGGAQKAMGITPDLCIQAKIVAGGLPGGAVAGKREILDRIDHASTAAKKIEKIAHPGTYNANPLSAAAAVTALSLVRDEDLAEKANRTAGELRKALTEVLVQEGVPWGIYGQSSTFLIYPNPYGDPIDPATFDPLKVPFAKLKGARGAGPLTGKIRMGLMTHGVDVMGAPGGFVSATHGGAEIEKTAHALRQTVRALKAEREVKAA
jgi:glutamate-1-semialdehyde 2,1-aminomutase